MDHLAQGRDVVELRRFKPTWPTDLGETTKERNIRFGVVADTETTGVQAHDKIIEVAAVPFFFDADTGDVIAVPATISGLQDPGFPIPPEASAVNGIFDAAVAGQRVPWLAIARVLGDAELVIVHNASFDRPRINAEMMGRSGGEIPPELADKVINGRWACSMSQLPWDDPKAPAKSQVVLCAWHGFFYSAHRATDDCLALLHLLEVSKSLPALWRAAHEYSYEVWAVSSPFSAKDALKARGYRWAAEPDKCWVRTIATLEEATEERGWLAQAIYGRGDTPAKVKRIEPRSRFR